jgi:dienelactone hydrolase
MLPRTRRAGLAAVATAFIALPAGASGAVTGVLAGHTMNGQPIPCVAQSDGVRVCHGEESGSAATDLRLQSFDGTPLEVYVTLPPAPASGADGDYPLVVQSHGWGDPPSGPNDPQYGGPTAEEWARDGYAVLQLAARGWGDSCGTEASRLVNVAACANGYIHLDDYRYEARDVQYAVGLLVDEGVGDPKRIGVTGESYGGGVTLELATLKNRVMNANGTLSPWRSPDGTPLQIAAAAPYATWSDMVYALMPNGRNFDDQVTSATADLSPVGVMKNSIDVGLYDVGALDGYYSTPGLNPQADVTTWFTNLNAGEPYTTAQDQYQLRQIAQFHSPYYLLDGAYGTRREAPAPLLIANGFTDDVFPADEALRYYNLERSLYPSDPIGLFLADIGHQRADNKPADLALLAPRIKAFFDHYLKGTAPRPTPGVTALTQTCPSSVPSGGPYHAAEWAALHPGEVDYGSAPAQTIVSTSGNPTISKAFDPVLGGLACTSAPATSEGAGVATYRLPAATGSGYTLLGSPTVVADLKVTGKYAYIAARLLDVNPGANTETLVARGDYRIDPNAPDSLQAFQLHPGAWHFAAGHVPELELLGQDAPYLRPSNGTFSISVSNLQLRLPVHEIPGARGTSAAVATPLPAVTSNMPPCARPASAISPQRSRVSRAELTVTGAAAEFPCARASAATQRAEHVTHVYVAVSTGAPHHRCSFLKANGKLSTPRRCSRPIELRARGTATWQLRLRVGLQRGRYLVKAQALDGRHARGRWSAITLVVRG